MTPPRIEPKTYQLPGQHLNHYATAAAAWPIQKFWDIYGDLAITSKTQNLCKDLPEYMKSKKLTVLFKIKEFNFFINLVFL